MNAPLLFRGGRLVRPDQDQPRRRDILVEEGQITSVEPDIDPPDRVQVIDCENKIILPGLFDLHVHAREPGREDLETIRTASEAAVNGGITGFLAMPNTDPPVDTGSKVQFIYNLAEQNARVPVYTAGCISKNRSGEELAEIGDMVDKGARMITDDGSPVEDPVLMRRAMEYSRSFPLIVASHCEIPRLSGDGVVNEGKTSYRLGLPGQPAISEEICLERDLRLAQLTGARLHIHHMTTGEGMESVRRFKQNGVEVTCEVTPHHLMFSADDIQQHDTQYKMNPPLRRPEDCQKLLEGLKEGVVDCIATDHAPHARFEKRHDFMDAPFGVLGLEVALLALHTRLIQPGKMSWNLLARSFSRNPRRIMDLDPIEWEDGDDAEFVVFDPEATTTVTESYLRSKSSNTPLLGETLQGQIDLVMAGGEILLDRTGETSHSPGPGVPRTPAGTAVSNGE